MGWDVIKISDLNLKPYRLLYLSHVDVVMLKILGNLENLEDPGKMASVTGDIGAYVTDSTVAQ